MRGTANLIASLVTGSPLTPGQVDDLTTLLAGADDDETYELTHLDPPAAVTYLTAAVGFIPLLDGPVVSGSGSSRQVTAHPLRVMRSSLDNSKPRALLSGVVTADTTIAMPASAPAGKWGFELLYAQLAYVDASNPTKGTTVTLQFATSPTYVTYATQPNFATLPANTQTTWNIPLAYVRNVDTDTTTPQGTVLSYPPAVASGISGNYRQRLISKFSGIAARRAYSAANQAPSVLGAGGGAYGGGNQKLLSTIIPALIGRHDSELHFREVMIPSDITGGVGGAMTFTVVDDTRDWRGCNFVVLFALDASATAALFAEDDTNNGTAAARHMPSQASNGFSAAVRIYLSVGNSWQANALTANVGAQFWAACVGTEVTNPPVNGADVGFLVSANHDVWGLVVDAATGALKFANNRSGAGGGPAIYATVLAWCPNHH